MWLKSPSFVCCHFDCPAQDPDGEDPEVLQTAKEDAAPWPKIHENPEGDKIYTPGMKNINIQNGQIWNGRIYIFQTMIVDIYLKFQGGKYTYNMTTKMDLFCLKLDVVFQMLEPCAFLKGVLIETEWSTDLTSPQMTLLFRFERTIFGGFTST